ncbi:MAG TPA: L-histidine N(alpha)-methyltransferase [Kofleriaceae bacterium]|nr:L-histidine N(alpha)-methyltransferase [Kofleriaceae bacterium]
MKAARALLSPEADRESMAADIRAGLTGSPRSLPCYLLYDKRGSELFEAITELPEYYLTRTELALLERHAGEIADLAGGPRSVIELGAGTGTKTRTILDAVIARRRPGAVADPPVAGEPAKPVYYPIDVSRSALDVAARGLARPGLEIRPLVGQYADWLPKLVDLPGPRMVVFIGSSLGNYTPEEAKALLELARRGMGSGDTFLLGADLRKDEKSLLAAYDDAAGVTAQFSKNVLHRINRELGADFDLDGFRHVAEWNPDRSRMELYLESTRVQSITIRDLSLTVDFSDGERIHTENSYKLALEDQLHLLAAAGLSPLASFLADDPSYALHLARRP